MITATLLLLATIQLTTVTPTENCLEVTSKAGSTSDSLIFSMPYLRFPASYQDVRIWTTTSDLEVTHIASNKWSVRTDGRSGQFSATLFTIDHNWRTSYTPVSYKWALEGSNTYNSHDKMVEEIQAPKPMKIILIAPLILLFLLAVYVYCESQHLVESE